MYFAGKKGTVVASTAAVGKTFLGLKYPKRVMDLGVMNFSSLKKNTESSTKEAVKNVEYGNPEFPQNYFKAINTEQNNYDLVLVAFLIELQRNPSFADELRNEHGVDFMIAIPKTSALKAIIKRMVDRGNNPTFIKYISETYPDIIKEFSKDKYDANRIFIEDNEYLEDALVRENLFVPSERGV